MLFKSNYSYQINKILFYVSVLINLLLITATFIHIPIKDFDRYFFNSDALYLPTMFRDIFIDRNTLEGWNFNPSPNFFPDMPLYFLFNGLFGNIVIVALLFSLMQYLIIILLFNRIVELVGKTNWLALGFSNVLLCLFYLSGLLFNDNEFTFYIMSNAYHIGAFVNTLACLVLLLQFLKSKKQILLILLLFYVILAVFSDKLFIVSFCIPISIASVITLIVKEKKHLILPLAIVIGASILGLILERNVTSILHSTIERPYRYLSFANMKDSFLLLIEHMNLFLKAGDAKTVIVLLSVFSLFLTTTIVVKKIRRKAIESWNVSEILYFLFFVFFMLSVFFAPVINGSYTGFDTIRYNYSVFIIGMLNLGFVTSYFKIEFNKLVSYSYYIGLFLLLGFVIFSLVYNEESLNKKINYYPEKVKTVDALAKKYQLKYGIAGYWDAVVINMFSKQGLHVYSTFNELTPYYHAGKLDWFYKHSDDKQKAIFNFIIVDNDEKFLNAEKLISKNNLLVEENGIRLLITKPFAFELYLPLPIQQDTISQ